MALLQYRRTYRDCFNWGLILLKLLVVVAAVIAHQNRHGAHKVVVPQEIEVLQQRRKVRVNVTESYVFVGLLVFRDVKWRLQARLSDDISLTGVPLVSAKIMPPGKGRQHRTRQLQLSFDLSLPFAFAVSYQHQYHTSYTNPHSRLLRVLRPHTNTSQ